VAPGDLRPDLQLSFFHIASMISNDSGVNTKPGSAFDYGDVQIHVDQGGTTGWGTWDKLAPFTDGYYVNLNDTDAKDKGADSNYGPNFSRLAALKKQFDPMNLFRLNANIKPA